MAKPISRRQFLRADFRAQRSALRPPWALQEEAFVAACTRCGDCVRACPPAILLSDAAGYPAVDFARGACTFCAACVVACPSIALTHPPSSTLPSASAWLAKAEIGDRCLAQRGVFCEVCRDLCPSHAILFRPAIGQASHPRINPQACNGCGACVSACPTAALSVTRPAVEASNVTFSNHSKEVSCT